MRRLAYGLPTLLLLAVAAVLLAPVTLLDGWLRERTADRLALGAATGSVWRGGADLAIALPDGRTASLPGLRWRVSPWAMLGGTVEGELLAARSTSGPPASGRFRLDRESLELRDVRLTVPAEALGGLGPIASVTPSGTLAADVGALRWVPRGGSGGGTLTWTSASLALTPEGTRVDLGVVTVRFEVSEGKVLYRVSSSGGSVGIDGAGDWEPGTAATLEGSVRASASAAAPVHAALARLGPPGADGAYRIRFPFARTPGQPAPR